MTLKEKLALLEDIFDMDEETLKEDMMLLEMDCWDSMAKLSLIALMDDEFDKHLPREKLRDLKTVQDILDLME